MAWRRVGASGTGVIVSNIVTVCPAVVLVAQMTWGTLLVFLLNLLLGGVLLLPRGPLLLLLHAVQPMSCRGRWCGLLSVPLRTVDHPSRSGYLHLLLKLLCVRRRGEVLLVLLGGLSITGVLIVTVVLFAPIVGVGIV